MPAIPARPADRLRRTRTDPGGSPTAPVNRRSCSPSSLPVAADASTASSRASISPSLQFEVNAGLRSGFGVMGAGPGPRDLEGRGDGPGVPRVRGRRLVVGGPGSAGIPHGRVQDAGAQGPQPLSLVQERAQARGGSCGEDAGVGDGVRITQAQCVKCRVRAFGPLLQGPGVPGARGGQLAQRRSTFALQRADGCGDRGSFRAVHALDLTQACHVLRRGDGGEPPEGEQGDDGHHQE